MEKTSLPDIDFKKPFMTQKRFVHETTGKNVKTTY